MTRRGVQVTKTHWENCPSHPMLVYLTTAYAPYFAFCAAGMEQPWGIVEIETDLLDQTRLVPDEDWLEQVSRASSASRRGMRGLAQCKTIESRTRWFREHIERFAHHWTDSIDGLGNAAHFDDVPASAVRRVAIYEPHSNAAVTGAAIDPMISLLNYRFCGEKYRALSAWFFGAELTPETYDQFAAVDPARRERLAKLLADRSGVTVVSTQEAA